MKFKTARAKLAAAAIALGLGVASAFAGVAHSVNVTLPEAVTVNGATLPGGAYRVDQIELGAGESAFVFVDSEGRTAAVAEGTKTLSPPQVNSWGGSKTTEFILAPDEGGKMHLNQMFIEGDQVGYHFINQK